MKDSDQSKLLQELISIDSSDPLGNEESIAQHIAQYLNQNEVQSQLIPSGPGSTSLYAIIPGESPDLIGLSGHLDTVQASEEWKVDPLIPLLQNGRLYGLGSSDMKSGIAMLISAFCIIARSVRSGNRIRKGLALLLSVGEEARNFQGARDFREAGLMKDIQFIIVGEPTGSKVVRASLGGILSRVTFFGKEAHAGTPDRGINAILSCARFILTLEERIPGLPDHRLSEDLIIPVTLNVGTISGGRATNIVPHKCIVELDMRCTGKAQKKSYLKALENTAAEAAKPGTFTVEILLDGCPSVTDLNNTWLKQFAHAYNATVGEPPIFDVLLGGCDLMELDPEGKIPFVIFGPGDPDQAHKPDEFVELTSLDKSLDILMNFLNMVLN
jgi:succinyl-diaminopimelate desuccinylase